MLKLILKAYWDPNYIRLKAQSNQEKYGPNSVSLHTQKMFQNFLEDLNYNHDLTSW